MHLPIVLCGAVCFLGALVFQEGFGQNIMLNTESSNYEENISNYSIPSWSTENSRFHIGDYSLCLSYMLIHISFIFPEFSNMKNAFTQLIIPTGIKNPRTR